MNIAQKIRFNNKLTLPLRTHIDWVWRDRKKIFFWQVITQRNQEELDLCIQKSSLTLALAMTFVCLLCQNHNQAKNKQTKKQDYNKSNQKISAQQKKVNKMRRQFMELEKIFEIHLSDKGLILKIYKKLIKLKSKKL